MSSEIHNNPEQRTFEQETVKDIKPESNLHISETVKILQSLYKGIRDSGKEADAKGNIERELKEMTKEYVDDLKKNSECSGTISDKPFRPEDLKKRLPEEIKELRKEFNGEKEGLTFLKELYINRGFYSNYEERINRTPVENGKWTGERGESEFISDSDEVVECMKDAKVEGVKYKDGCPDFELFSKGNVEISDMSTNRHTYGGKPGNFEQADAALAKQRGNGCTARDVANWRKQHGYTWHEMNDMKTCQKVPASINKVFRHLGGVGECKRREEMLDEIAGKYTANKGGIFDE